MNKTIITKILNLFFEMNSSIEKMNKTVDRILKEVEGIEAKLKMQENIEQGESERVVSQKQKEREIEEYTKEQR